MTEALEAAPLTDQRVSHAGILENKRLSHAVSIVKTQQGLKRATKMITNGEKDGYKKRERKVYGADLDSKTSDIARGLRLRDDIFALHSERLYCLAPTRMCGRSVERGRSSVQLIRKAGGCQHQVGFGGQRRCGPVFHLS